MLWSSKVAEVYEKKNTELYLRGGILHRMDNDAVPSLLARCLTLKKLDLSCNALSTIPDSVLCLTLLEELKVHSNHLAIIPDGVCRLANLQKLRLENNRLSFIPATLSQLSKLQLINLSHNQFRSFPFELLSTLRSFQTLDLSHNRLRRVGNEINTLTNLTSLNLSNNRLRTLPDSLDGLAHLRKLHIANNQLEFIDTDSLFSLGSLHMLDIRFNSLKQLPYAIACLPWLSEVLFEGNPLLDSYPHNAHKLSFDEIKELVTELDGVLSKHESRRDEEEAIKRADKDGGPVIPSVEENEQSLFTLKHTFPNMGEDELIRVLQDCKWNVNRAISHISSQTAKAINKRSASPMSSHRKESAPILLRRTRLWQKSKGELKERKRKKKQAAAISSSSDSTSAPLEDNVQLTERKLRVEASSNLCATFSCSQTKLLRKIRTDESVFDLRDLLLAKNVVILAPPNISMGEVTINRKFLKTHLIVIDQSTPTNFTTLCGLSGRFINNLSQILLTSSSSSRRSSSAGAKRVDILCRGTSPFEHGSIEILMVSDPLVDVDEWVRTESDEADDPAERSLEGYYLMNPGKRKKEQHYREKIFKQWKKWLKDETVSAVDQRERIEQACNKKVSQLLSHPYFTDPPVADLEIRSLKIELRKTDTHSQSVFGPPMNHLEDEQLAIKMEKLKSFVTYSTLTDDGEDLPADCDISDAIVRLCSINEKKTTKEKLECISGCCCALFSQLSKSAGDASADQFLPLLIYTIIQSGATRLYSNMQYIESFGDDQFELSGENAYHYTNMYSAVSFIRDLKASDINMPRDEFDRQMRDVEQVRSSLSLGNIYEFISTSPNELLVADIPRLLQYYKVLAAGAMKIDNEEDVGHPSSMSALPASPRRGPVGTDVVVKVKEKGNSLYRRVQIPEQCSIVEFESAVLSKLHPANTSDYAIGTIISLPDCAIQDDEDVMLLKNGSEVEVEVYSSNNDGSGPLSDPIRIREVPVNDEVEEEEEAEEEDEDEEY